jgi:MFS family permease
MNRNVFLLAICQAMLMTSVSLTITSSALIGTHLSSSSALGTVPLAMLFLVTMLVMFPASSLMQRLGRKPVFIFGALAGAVGVTLAAWGIYTESFMLFTIACGCIGAFNGIGQFYRFAAVEAVDAANQSRAISFTLAGGVIAAILDRTSPALPVIASSRHSLPVLLHSLVSLSSPW